MKLEEKLYFRHERTEEVQHIIDRMPTRFGVFVSVIVAFIFILLLAFGWLVRYPDVIYGQITINANSSPVKLISNTAGRLKINKLKSMDNVKEGQLLAYIENSADPTNVMRIDSLLRLFDPTSDFALNSSEKLPSHLSLGELNIKYYGFITRMQELINYKHDKLFDKQQENLNELLKEQNDAIVAATKRVEMSKNSLDYIHKFYHRDSILFLKKVISESELDKSQMNYLNVKDGVQNAINNLINARQSVQLTEGKLQELTIQNPEKEKELRTALISSYNDLFDSIKIWEQKYVFRAVFNGKIQFLKFYNENQFIQAGEPVFTIVPTEDKIFGQVVLPAQGSGKIRIGQEVIIKLDNYPYMEYGSITGRVKSVSLAPGITKTEKAGIDTYMVLVDLPNQLKTNYGSFLNFKTEAKGTAEIITNDRRFIQRLFDNLKYNVSK